MPSSACQHLVQDIYSSLDLDGNGVLDPVADLAFLTPQLLDSVSQELDNLVQEIRDLSSDQWQDALQVSYTHTLQTYKFALE